ncbi:hypothetical protein B0H14DRAFT_3441813 [Mycena olivaceomarginata]|nr:hypothetical protein B0H14DRAFT_3441813 [Mycena olivaceomarginata]
MASQKKATARKPASSRNTGKRKQPKSKPAYKGATHRDTETGEDKAAAAVVSLASATPASVIEQPEAVDGVVPVAQPDDNHLDPDYNNDDSARGSDGSDGGDDSSDTSEEEDNVNDSELDDAVAQIAPSSWNRGTGDGMRGSCITLLDLGISWINGYFIPICQFVLLKILFPICRNLHTGDFEM